MVGAHLGYATGIKLFIASLSDIPMFYIKYLTVHSVLMHADAIRLCACEREIKHELMLVDYPPVHTLKPYNNVHLKQRTSPDIGKVDPTVQESGRETCNALTIID